MPGGGPLGSFNSPGLALPSSPDPVVGFVYVNGLWWAERVGSGRSERIWCMTTVNRTKPSTTSSTRFRRQRGPCVHPAVLLWCRRAGLKLWSSSFLPSSSSVGSIVLPSMLPRITPSCSHPLFLGVTTIRAAFHVSRLKECGERGVSWHATVQGTGAMRACAGEPRRGGGGSDACRW